VSTQNRPWVATRDIFLCQIVALVIFLVAQKAGYYSNWWLGLTLALIAPVACGFLGVKIRNRMTGAFNAYSLATLIGALIFVLKWWPEIAARSA
jgi:xanthine/uracil permease